MTNRELDAAIAEALGNPQWDRSEPQTNHDDWYGQDCDGYGPNGECSVCTGIIACDPPAYHADPVAADALMRALRERGWDVLINAPAGKPVLAEVHAGKIHGSFRGTWTEALAKAALSALTVAGEP